MVKMNTPAQAAKIAGVSRSTVSRALKEGELRGIRDNRQRWKISDENLQEWLGHVEHKAPAHSNAVKIAQLETENRMLLENLLKTEARADRLEAMLGERWWHPLRDWMRKQSK
jgi:excisionase family DNA binding protein